MKKLLHLRRCFKCLDYRPNKRSIVKEITLGIGDEWKIRPKENMVVFVLDGKMTYLSGQLQSSVFINGQMFFLPRKYHRLSFRAISETKLVIVRLFNKVIPHDYFASKDFPQTQVLEETTKTVPFQLEINSALEKYLNMLFLFDKQELSYHHYKEDKVKELLLILKTFYSKEDLYRFFFDFS